MRCIEVKGRVRDADTMARSEILYSLNKPDNYRLAIVDLDQASHRVHYIRRPFRREPDFGANSVNYSSIDSYPAPNHRAEALSFHWE